MEQLIARQTAFTGVFDGNGHKISHLTITGRSYLGLFGELAYGAKVKDLGVTDVNISGSGDVVGGLLGHNQWGTVTRCYSTGTVYGDDNTGGLMGRNSGHVTQCYSTVAVSGDYLVGGLVGTSERNGVVTDCYSTSTVSGRLTVGGLVGSNYGSITASYSTGTVRGESRVGGLMGGNYYGNANVTSSFWDMDSSGQSSSAEGTGKTTAEMQTASTFVEAGWDFADETVNGTQDIWWIPEGQDYPRLWWETAGIDN